MAEQHIGRFVGPCYRCKCAMWLPSDLYGAARKSSNISFYCAYGHPQIFAEGESEEAKLRRERDRLAQQIEWKDDIIRQVTEQKDNALKLAGQSEAKRKNLTKRISAGCCPHCHRNFVQLRKHMASKHKEIVQ